MSCFENGCPDVGAYCFVPLGSFAWTFDCIFQKVIVAIGTMCTRVCHPHVNVFTRFIIDRIVIATIAGLSMNPFFYGEAKF